MMIVDAIRSAATPHAVQFLVTAYIESLRHFERSCGVPAGVLDLPIAGTRDLAQRLHILDANTVGLDCVVAASELAVVLSCALERIAALGDETAAPSACAATLPGRNDSLRSALSV